MRIVWCFLVLACLRPALVTAQWERLPQPLGGSGIIQLATDGGWLYVLSGGGIFRSADAGANWAFLEGTQRFEFNARHICVEQGTIYLLDDRQGLLRSDDDGRSWVLLFRYPNESWQGERPFKVFASGKTVLLCTNFGFYTSLNKGDNWAKTNDFFEEGCLGFSKIGQRLFIATEYRVWRSDDGGLNWAQVFQNLPGIAGFSVREGWLYLFYKSTSRLSRSGDGGASWQHFDTQVISPDLYDEELEDHLLWVGDTLVHLTDARCQHGAFHVHHSLDRGQTWLPSNWPNGYLVSPFVSDAIVVDKRIVLGTYRGIGIMSHINAKPKASNQGLNITVAHQIERSDTRLWAATNRGVCTSADRGQTWAYKFPFGEVEEDCNAQFAVWARQNRVIMAYYNTCLMYHSDDEGETWQGFSADDGLCRPCFGDTVPIISLDGKLHRMLPGDAQFAPFAELPSPGARLADCAPGVLLLRQGQALVYSRDEGQTWDSIPRFPFGHHNSYGHSGRLESDGYMSQTNDGLYRRFDFETKIWQPFKALNGLSGDTIDTRDMVYLGRVGGFEWRKFSNEGICYALLNTSIWYPFVPALPVQNVRCGLMAEDGFWIGAIGIYHLPMAGLGGQTANAVPQFALFPNPSAGALNISSDIFLSTDTQLEVFDMAGRIIHATSLHPGQQWSLQLGQIPAGYYAVRLSGTHSAVTLKWIKKQ
jgi:photosystem II stability/assembly factor-like uncharacterized protein